jgi:ParB-like chromosome segregation protein Spo0J
MKTPDPAADIPVHCAHAAIVDWSTLKPHPRNPNRHPTEQIALLAKNIRALGWRHPVIVSKLSGYIVAGHARIEAAKLLNINAVPVDYQLFASTEEETAYLIADNRIAELAERDNAVLKDLLQELDTGATDMDLTGYDSDSLEELMTQEHQDESDVIFDQSVQMEPAKEFLVILLEPSEIEEARQLLELKQVRRGGYKAGSAFDAVGSERCIRWGRVRNAICNSK